MGWLDYFTDPQARTAKTLGEFRSALDRARGYFGAEQVSASKWLRPTEELLSWYMSEHERLGLPRGSRVCDLGAGPGFTLWFLRQLRGCRVTGIEHRLREDYLVLWRELGIDRAMVEQSIERFVSLSLPEKYDFILAIGINFDHVPGPDREKLWSVEEFEFFIDDNRKFLKPGGELILRFNRAPAPALRKIFAEQGARKNGNMFRIPR